MSPSPNFGDGVMYHFASYLECHHLMGFCVSILVSSEFYQTCTILYNLILLPPARVQSFFLYCGNESKLVLHTPASNRSIEQKIKRSKIYWILSGSISSADADCFCDVIPEYEKRKRKTQFTTWVVWFYNPSCLFALETLVTESNKSCNSILITFALVCSCADPLLCLLGFC